MLLVRHIRKPTLLVTQLDVRKASTSRLVHGSRYERPGHLVIVGDNAALVDEGQRHRESAEQPASKLHERQDARRRDRSRTADRLQRAVAEDVLEDRAPRGQMVSGRLRMLLDEPVPRRGIERCGDLGRSERKRYHQATAAEARSSTAGGGCAGRTSRSGAKRKSREQPPQPCLGSIEVAVVAEPAQRVGRGSRG